MNEWVFTKSYDIIFATKNITNLKTGMTVELSLADKALYTRMRKRYIHFKEDMNSSFYDDISTFAEDLQISESTIIRSIKRLKTLGAISVFQTKARKGRSNSYVVHDLCDELQFRLNVSEEAIKKHRLNKSAGKLTVATSYAVPQDNDDEFDEPF